MSAAGAVKRRLGHYHRGVVTLLEPKDGGVLTVAEAKEKAVVDTELGTYVHSPE